VAEVQDARQRVLASRAELDDELRQLNAAARSAADIPAKIRRSPAKAAAVAGGVAFLALKGPQRIFGAGRRALRGKDAPLPSKMLPAEIDKSLRALGSDGEKVRGALERDFADYVAKAAAERRRVRRILLLTVAQPLLTQLARRGANWLASPDRAGFERRLEELRAKAEGRARGEASAAAELGETTEMRAGSDVSTTSPSPSPTKDGSPPA
jgi:hypothetical protein